MKPKRCPEMNMSRRCTLELGHSGLHTIVPPSGMDYAPDEELGIEPPKSLPTNQCGWAEDSEGTWQTDCGHSFIVNEGTPTENGMKFCSYCGGELVQSEFVEVEDSAS